MKAPAFWQNHNLISVLFTPFGYLYQSLGWVRTRMTKPYRSSLPVLCVGNLTSGGTGKTPLTAWLADRLTQKGYKPVILTRGYGGSLKGPLLVTSEHKAEQCGDEPLLLRQYADIVVSRNRAEGAAFIESQQKFDIIIMDDGFQNPQLQKDMVILVFDGAIGIQNGKLFPAGPLRTSVDKGLKQADMICVNGKDQTQISSLSKMVPCYEFTLSPSALIAPPHDKKRYLAFAGIGRPSRFFESLEQTGYEVIETHSFGDHHMYRPVELEALAQAAQKQEALLITTEKDWVRLPKIWQSRVAYLPVQASFHASIIKDIDKKLQRLAQR